MSDLRSLLDKIGSLPDVEEEPSGDEKMLAAIQALTEVVGSLKVSPESIAELRGEVKALGAQLSAITASVERLEGREFPEQKSTDLTPLDRKISLLTDALSRVSDRVTGISGELRAMKSSYDAAGKVAEAVIASKAGGFEFEIGPTETTPARKMRVKPT